MHTVCSELLHSCSKNRSPYEPDHVSVCTDGEDSLKICVGLAALFFLRTGPRVRTFAAFTPHTSELVKLVTRSMYDVYEKREEQKRKKEKREKETCKVF